MVAKVKTVNYTPAQVAVMIAEYAANPSKETVAALAEKFGKTVRSIVAKLAREDVYQKKEYVAKDGTKSESKAVIVADIAAKLGVPADDVGSLESATKAALKLVADGLAAQAVFVTEPEAAAE